jgi:hypothetical protein
MTSKLSAQLITLILSSLLLPYCGPKAPLVDDCVIAPTDVKCNRAKPAPKQNASYSLTPLQANAYICLSNGDFLVSKIYLINLEDNLAKCIKTPVVKPKVFDCGIEGDLSVVKCSDGVTVNTLTWDQAIGYLCLSPSDYESELVYRNNLIQDIANCTAN